MHKYFFVNLSIESYFITKCVGYDCIALISASDRLHMGQKEERSGVNRA